MARKSYKHPTVFVGCPYRPVKKFEAFRQLLETIPLEFIYADSSISTVHVLEKVRRGINNSDYCLFDITNWNANVTLEVGMAEGLNLDYYILFKPGYGKKKKPPVDLEGFQHFEYRSLDSFKSDSLASLLLDHLVKPLTHPRWIYDRLSGVGLERDKKFRVAMRILSHFKKYKLLYRKDLLARVVRGSWLREESVEEILSLLKERDLIKGRLDGQKWASKRNLYWGIKVK